MDILFLAKTLEVIGKVLLGITVLIVHSHVIKEHKIDKDVLSSMRQARIPGILGIIFIIAGYIIEVFLT